MAVVFIESDLSPVISHFERENTFSFDLETTGLSPLDSRILLMQIGFPETQYVIDINAFSPEYVANRLKPYFTSNNWKKIIQNAKFEQKFMQYFYKTDITNVWDTMLAESIIMPDARGVSLETLANNYLSLVLDKEVRKSFFNKKDRNFSQDQIKYAAEDVRVLFGIRAGQEKRIAEFGLTKVAELEFELAGVVADMENTGSPINVELWKSKLKEYEKAHEAARIKMHEVLFDGGKMDEQLGMFERNAINLGSPKQVLAALNKVGLNVTSTDERTLGILKHPAAQALLEYRGLDKIMTSYGRSFLDKVHPFTGRIHPDFQQIGAGTGRFSCREPNMQQIPEKFHECITADGYSVVTADYSQIELRILAQLSDDPNLIKAFNSGDDLHKATASMMFNIPLDTVTKEQRFTAKTINFGVSYGMKVKKLRDTLNAEAIQNKKPQLNYPQVQDLLNRYYRTYTVAKGWLEQAGFQAYRQGYSETILGRKRFYTKPDQQALDPDSFKGQVEAIKRQGANSPIQGTNADITKLAMINVYNEIKDAGYKANIILQVHEEIVVLAQKNQAEDVKIMLEDTMRKTASEVITKVPIKADAVISNAWNK